MLADRYDLLVFDFDGTLCDSVEVKNKAFHLLYLDERGPEFAERVYAYHLANIGLSRYDKIRHIETELIGTDPTEDRVDEVAGRFGRIVEDQVIAAPLFDGVREFLDQSDVPMAVASATPGEELRRIVSAKGIASFFAGIDGSPRTKAEIVSDFAVRFASDPQRVLVVGDQQSDAAAAAASGTDFVAIVPDGRPHDWATPFPVVTDFVAFTDLVAAGRS